MISDTFYFTTPCDSTHQGDSGGPLMCKKQNGIWVQIGVASYGHKKWSVNKVNVFASLPYYYDEIYLLISNYNCFSVIT